MAEEKPLRVEFKFTDDTHTVVRFELPPRLAADAADVTRLVNALIDLRSRMEPPFPVGPPVPSEMHVIADADLGVELDEYGVSLTILHPGVGWIRTRLRREQAQRLAARLHQVLALAPDQPTH